MKGYQVAFMHTMLLHIHAGFDVLISWGVHLRCRMFGVQVIEMLYMMVTSSMQPLRKWKRKIKKPSQMTERDRTIL